MTVSRALGVVAGLALTATGLAAGPATAAAPVMERVAIDETFEDEFLTEACGVPVISSQSGFRIIRDMETKGTGLLFLVTINSTVTSTSGDNTYVFKDVGADLGRLQPDGSEVLSIVGQIPFGWNGVLKVDPTTGEVLHEPRDRFEQQLAEACAALTA